MTQAQVRQGYRVLPERVADIAARQALRRERYPRPRDTRREMEAGLIKPTSAAAQSLKPGTSHRGTTSPEEIEFAEPEFLQVGSSSKPSATSSSTLQPMPSAQITTTSASAPQGAIPYTTGGAGETTISGATHGKPAEELATGSSTDVPPTTMGTTGQPQPPAPVPPSKGSPEPKPVETNKSLTTLKKSSGFGILIRK